MSFNFLKKVTICCLQFSNTLIWVFWLMFKTSDCLQSAYTKGQIRHSYVVCVLPERESFNRQKLLDKANFYLFTVCSTDTFSFSKTMISCFPGSCYICHTFLFLFLIFPSRAVQFLYYPFPIFSSETTLFKTISNTFTVPSLE